MVAGVVGKELPGGLGLDAEDHEVARIPPLAHPRAAARRGYRDVDFRLGQDRDASVASSIHVTTMGENGVCPVHERSVPSLGLSAPRLRRCAPFSAYNRLSVIVLIVVGVVRPLRLVLGLAAG